MQTLQFKTAPDSVSIVARKMSFDEGEAFARLMAGENIHCEKLFVVAVWEGKTKRTSVAAQEDDPKVAKALAFRWSINNFESPHDMTVLVQPHRK